MRCTLVRMSRGLGSPAAGGQGRHRRRQTSGVIFPCPTFVFYLFLPYLLLVSFFVSKDLCVVAKAKSRVLKLIDFFGNKTGALQ